MIPKENQERYLQKRGAEKSGKLQNPIHPVSPTTAAWLSFAKTEEK